jgi:pyruvate/2-oxoglutarate dehydrogenase complex dihydrolipoamide dehydrogenase (E3) component
MRSEFDMVVIGGGMAGLNAVQRAVTAGLRVAVVERDRVGGTCPIRGCIPTKALVRSAEIAHEARRAAEFGIRVGAVEVDFAAVMRRVRGIIDQGATATRAWVEGLEGVELIEGEGSFAGPGEVRVDGRVLTAPHIVIATGAVPGVPPIPGLADTPHLTSDDVLALEELPGRLLIIGAGPIALELGQALGRLGATVTMVEVLPRLLPGAEPELADRLGEHLAEEGIEINVGVAVERTEPGPGGVRVVIGQDGRQRVLEGDALLVATGRPPAVAALNLEAVGITDARRGVPVDAHLRTAAPGVFAAGDVLGPPWGAFTPVARRLGGEVVEQALGLATGPVDPDIGSRAIFTDPELAMVGLTEQAARDAGFAVRVGTGAFRGGKARAWGEERGMVKVVAQAGTGRILGAQVLAYHAADLIHPVAVAMTQGDGAIAAMRATPHVHPTLGEVVRSAVEAAG